MQQQSKKERQVGIRLDPDLWHNFKLECMKRRRPAKDVVQELMQDFIQGKQETDEPTRDQSTTKDKET